MNVREGLIQCGCCGEGAPRTRPNQEWGTCQGCIDAGCTRIPGSYGDQLRGANCPLLVKAREAVAIATSIRPPEPTRITAETTLGQLAIEKVLLGITSITIDRTVNVQTLTARGMRTSLCVSLNVPGVGMTFGYADELHDALDQAFANLRRTLGGEPIKAAYPRACAQCKDTGVIQTGNNDLPCHCPAGDHALFNTEYGRETGAQIKARR